MKLRSKSIMTLIYCALLSIPLVSILSRVIYVQANKNAYQSYSETQVRKIEQINNAQSYADTFTYNVKPLDSSHGTSGKQYFSYISIGNVNSNAVSFSIYTNETNAHLIMFWDINNVEVQRFTWGASQNNDFEEFYFTKTSGSDLFNYANVFLIYETTDKLDNVFEYSINKLVDDNNFGQLNFFEWFSGFLLNDAQQNNLYIHFANWYMCYAMLISLMQILFLCLMWFVNFSRKVLDKGMNYDW